MAQPGKPSLALIVRDPPFAHRAARADLDVALAAAAMDFRLEIFFFGQAIMQLALERDCRDAMLPAGYRAWAAQGARFHFVSSSPWHLYEPLKEFLAKAGFPPATFNLKLVRLTDRTITNLFKKGTETKPLQIEPLLRAYPARRFVLVGDSGEQDPEVYAALARKFPAQIVRVYIRNVTKASPTDERFRTLFAGIAPERWALFTDPSKLDLPVTKPTP